MEENKISTITKEQLIENGWKETGDPVHLMAKDITSLENEEEDAGKIKLCLHRLYNQPVFALSIPDGYLININPGSIEELNLFEKLIVSVDTPY